MQKYLFLGLLVASSMVMAQPAPMAKAAYDTAKTRIDADKAAAENRCVAMQGKDKDICEEEAEGQEKVAKAELEQLYRPSARNARKVAEAKIEAEYDIAKEKCDIQTGAAENACEKEAKAQQARSKANLKTSTKVK